MMIAIIFANARAPVGCSLHAECLYYAQQVIAAERLPSLPLLPIRLVLLQQLVNTNYQFYRTCITVAPAIMRLVGSAESGPFLPEKLLCA